VGFERWLSLSTTSNGVLTIFHLKSKQVFERGIGTLVLFYKKTSARGLSHA
jgi:hypothetical protein